MYAIWHVWQSLFLGLGLWGIACAPQTTGLVADAPDHRRGAVTASSSEPSSAAAGAIAPDPALNQRWEPDTPQADDDAGIAWAPAVMTSRCDRPQKLPAVIESEQQFRQWLCKESNVDWEHYQVVIYSGRDPTALRGLRVTQVKATPQRTVIFVEPVGSCGADVWGASSPVAIIPRSIAPVLFVKRASVGLPSCPAPGY